MDNTMTVSGTLGKDPELRYTTGGRGVASFSLAVNRRYMVNNEWQEETSWLNCVAWGDLGEHVAQSCLKGTRLIVTGRYSQREYTNKEGNKQYSIELIAEDIGPSLKWATATVERAERSQASQPAQKRSNDPVYGEEEPF